MAATDDDGPDEERVEVTPEPVRFDATPPTTQLDRLLDGVRITVLGVVLGVGLAVGLSVGFGVESAWRGLVAGVGSVGVLVLAFRIPPTRNWLARLADWIISRP